MSQEISMDLNSFLKEKVEYERKKNELSSALLDANVNTRVKELIRNANVDIDNTRSKEFVEFMESMKLMTELSDLVISVEIYDDAGDLFSRTWNRVMLNVRSLNALHAYSSPHSPTLHFGSHGACSSDFTFKVNRDFKVNGTLHYSVEVKDSDLRQRLCDAKLYNIFGQWFMGVRPTKFQINLYSPQMIHQQLL